MQREYTRRFSIELLESRRLLDASSVLVSEIMYNPRVTDQERAVGFKDRDFEFIEVLNTGNVPARLAGAALDDAVSFIFGQVTLEPGQFAVVVHNRQAFESRYGRGPLIAGQYSGTLGNGGDRVLWKDSAGRSIQDFTYDDAWYPTTDGLGVSLTAINPTNRDADRNQSASWRPSSRDGGSPGYDNGQRDPRPDSLTAHVLSSRHVALRWIPPAQSNGVIGYRVYRDDRLLGTSKEASFVDSTVVPEGVYSYQVSTVQQNGTEHLSMPAHVSIEPVGGNLAFDQGVPLATVRVNALTELSGMVASRRNQNVLWTHNDGAQTAVHAVSLNGKYLGAHHLQGIQTRDWEDIAIGPGPVAGIDYLYIGDIGGKNPKRNVVQVFRVREPNVSETDSAQTHSISNADTITLQYPDGNEFNAETLLSDPRTGDLYVIPKRGSETPVYRAAASTLQPGSSVLLERVAYLGFPNVSGGDISPNGAEIIIRNEDLALLFRRGEDQSVASALQNVSRSILVPVIGRPDEPNGEAITFGGNGRNYFTISEGQNPPLHFFRRIPPALAGDANRDQQFSSSDLVQVFQAGKYETGDFATFAQGDWNGDGFFDSGDLVAAFKTGRFESGFAAAVAFMGEEDKIIH